jgi:hypothetical protein
MSGTWKLNRELSPSLMAPGRSGGRGSGRGGGPSLTVGLTAMQRGGRGGGEGGAPGPDGAGPLPPLEVEAQRVLRVVEQVPADVTIAATSETVSFKDASGEGTFRIDGKTVALSVAGAEIKVKSKWDRAALRQEFWSARRKVTRTWDVDADDHLILNTKVEGVLMKMIETRAVFVRQPR